MDKSESREGVRVVQTAQYLAHHVHREGYGESFAKIGAAIPDIGEVPTFDRLHHDVQLLAQLARVADVDEVVVVQADDDLGLVHESRPIVVIGQIRAQKLHSRRSRKIATPHGRKEHLCHSPLA